MVHVVEGKYDRLKSIRGPGATDEAMMRLLERVGHDFEEFSKS